MATPLATASDLAARLKRPVWTDPAELDQVETLLDDASTDLRSEIGWQVYPPVVVTVEVAPDLLGRVRLSGSPITAVSSVTQNGTAVSSGSYEWTGGVLYLPATSAATVTYTVGYADPPPDLLKWTCVLAAQALALAGDDRIGATPKSESLADYRISYSERQQMGDLPIPDRVLERLRSAYGQGVHTT